MNDIKEKTTQETVETVENKLSDDTKSLLVKALADLKFNPYNLNASIIKDKRDLTKHFKQDYYGLFINLSNDTWEIYKKDWVLLASKGDTGKLKYVLENQHIFMIKLPETSTYDEEQFKRLYERGLNLVGEKVYTIASEITMMDEALQKHIQYIITEVAKTGRVIRGDEVPQASMDTIANQVAAVMRKLQIKSLDKESNGNTALRQQLISRYATQYAKLYLEALSIDNEARSALDKLIPVQ